MSTEAVITTRKRGDTYDLLATIKLNGAAYDMTGATEIQLLVDSAREVSSGSTAERVLEGALSDPVNGVVSFDMSASGNPTDLDKGEYFAEITFLNSSGKRMTTNTFEYHQLGSLRGT